MLTYEYYDREALAGTDPSDFKCWRIAQMCFGLSGAFAPVIRPAFQGLRGMRKRSGWPMATSHCGGPRYPHYAFWGANAPEAVTHAPPQS